MESVNKRNADLDNTSETSILEISTNVQDDTLNYQTADEENNSKYYSMIADSTLEASSADVTLESKSVIDDSFIEESKLVNRLASVQSKSVDKLQIHEKIDAAKILSGGVEIFEDNENSNDEQGLVIDYDAQATEAEHNTKVEEDSQKESDHKETNECDKTIEPEETKDVEEKTDVDNKINKSREDDLSAKSDEVDLAVSEEVSGDGDAEKTDNYSALLQSNLPEGSSEVTLLIDDKNVDAIDIGEGVFIYKNDDGELTAIQITMNEDGTTNFKCLHVGKNEDGNLEVYEEQVSQVPVTTEELESMRSQELSNQTDTSQSLKPPESCDNKEEKESENNETSEKVVQETKKIDNVENSQPSITDVSNINKTKEDITPSVEHKSELVIEDIKKLDVPEIDKSVVEPLTVENQTSKSSVEDFSMAVTGESENIIESTENISVVDPIAEMDSSQSEQQDTKNVANLCEPIAESKEAVSIESSTVINKTEDSSLVHDIVSDVDMKEISEEKDEIDKQNKTEDVNLLTKLNEVEYDNAKIPCEPEVTSIESDIKITSPVEDVNNSSLESVSNVVTEDATYNSPVNVCGVVTKISDPVLPSEITSDSQDSTSNMLAVINNEESSNTMESQVSSCSSINPPDSVISEQLSITDTLCTKLGENNKVLNFELSNLEFKNESTQSKTLSEDVSQESVQTKSVSDGENSNDSNAQTLVIEDNSVSQDSTLEAVQKDQKSISTIVTKDNNESEIVKVNNDVSLESQMSVESDEDDYVVGEPVTGDSGAEWNKGIDDKTEKNISSPDATNNKSEVEKPLDNVVVNISDNNNDISKTVSEKENVDQSAKNNEVIIKEIDFDKFVRRNSVQMFEECVTVDYEDVTETIKTKSVPVLELECKTSVTEVSANNVQITTYKVSEAGVKIQQSPPVASKASRSLDESITFLATVAERTPSPKKNINSFKPSYGPVENNKYMKSPYTRPAFPNQSPKAYIPNAVLPQSPNEVVRKHEALVGKPRTYVPAHKPASPPVASPLIQRSDKSPLSFSLLSEKPLPTQSPTSPQVPTQSTTTKAQEPSSQDTKSTAAGINAENISQDNSKVEGEINEAQKVKNRQPRKQVFTPITRSNMEIIFPNLFNNAQGYKKESDAKALKLKKEQDLKFKQLSKKEQSRRNELINNPPVKPPVKAISPMKPVEKTLSKESFLSTPVKGFDKSSILKSPMETMPPVRIAEKPIVMDYTYERINQDVTQPLNPIKVPVEVLSKDIPHALNTFNNTEKVHINEPPKVASPIKTNDKMREQYYKQGLEQSPIARKDSPVKSVISSGTPTKEFERKSYSIDLPSPNIERSPSYLNKYSNHHAVDNSRLKEYASPRTYSRVPNKSMVQNVYNQNAGSPKQIPGPLETIPKSTDVIERKIHHTSDVSPNQTTTVTRESSSPPKKVEPIISDTSKLSTVNDTPMKTNKTNLDIMKTKSPTENVSKASPDQVTNVEKEVKKNNEDVTSSIINNEENKLQVNKLTKTVNSPVIDTTENECLPSSKKSPQIKTPTKSQNQSKGPVSPKIKENLESDPTVTDSAKRKRGRPKKIVTDSPVSSKPKEPTKSPVRKVDNDVVIKSTPKNSPKVEEKSRASSISPFGKIDENIKCPICFKTFRTHNVLIKHVKHCNGTIDVEIIKTPKRRKLNDSKLEESMECDKVDDDINIDKSKSTKKDKIIDTPVQNDKNNDQNVGIPKELTTDSLKKKQTPSKEKTTEIQDTSEKTPKNNEDTTVETHKNKKNVDVEKIKNKDTPVEKNLNKLDSSVEKLKKQGISKKKGERSIETPIESPATPVLLKEDKTVFSKPDSKTELNIISGDISRKTVDSKSEINKNETLETIVLDDSFVDSFLVSDRKSEKISEENNKSEVTDTANTSKNENVKKYRAPGRPPKNKSVEDNRQKPTTASPMSRLSKILNKNPPDNSPISCTVCGKTFRQLAHMVYHRTSKHNVEETDIPAEDIKSTNDEVKSKSDVTESAVETDAILKCETCHKGFRKLHHLVEHREMHANAETKSRRTSVASVKSEPEAGFRCDTCDKSFRKLHHLVEHRELHLAEVTETIEPPAQTTPSKANEAKPTEDATCPGCGKSFRKRHHMVEHRDVHCSPSKKSKSDDGSIVDNNIRLSIASSTSDEGNSCGICGKSYRKLHHMVEHRESHSEVREEKAKNKPYPTPEPLSTKDIIHECSRCYMVFPNENSLNKHVDICSKKRLVKKSFNFNTDDNEDAPKTGQIEKVQEIVTIIDEDTTHSKENDVVIIEPEDKTITKVDEKIRDSKDTEISLEDVPLASRFKQLSSKSTGEESSIKSQKLEKKPIANKNAITKPQISRKSTLTKDTISSRSRKSIIVKPKCSSDDVPSVSRSLSVRKSSISSESVSSRNSLKRKSSSSVECLPAKKSNTKDAPISTLRKSLDSVSKKITKVPNRRSLPAEENDNDDDSSVKYKLNESDELDVKYKINPEFRKSIKRLSQSSSDNKPTKRLSQSSSDIKPIKRLSQSSIESKPIKTFAMKAKARRSESALSGLKVPKEKILQTIMEESSVRYSFPKSPKPKTTETEKPLAEASVAAPAVKKTTVAKPTNATGKKVVVTKKTNIVVANRRKSLGGRKSIDSKKLPGVGKKLQLRCCSQVFSSQALLADHRKTHKDKQKVHKCDCGKVFDTEGLLKRHMDIEHTPPKSYKCSVCGASVRTAAQYAKHKRDHETQSKQTAMTKKVADNKQQQQTKTAKTNPKNEVPKTVNKVQPSKSKSPVGETRKGVKRKVAHGGVPLSDKMKKAMAGAKF